MSDLAEIISRNEDQIRAEWIRDMGTSVQRADLMSKTELDEQCKTLLGAVVARREKQRPADIKSAGWTQAREFLEGISASRARQGFSPTRSGQLRPVAQAAALFGHPPRPGQIQDKMFDAMRDGDRSARRTGAASRRKPTLRRAKS